MSRKTGCIVTTAVLTLMGMGATRAHADWTDYRGPQRDGVVGEPVSLTPTPDWDTQIGIGYSAIVVEGDRAWTLGNTDNTDTLYCFNASTGEVLWQQSYPCRQNMGGYFGPRGTPTVAGGRVYTVSLEGEVICWNAETGERLWTFRLTDHGASLPQWGFSTSPLVMGEQVVVDAGTVFSLRRDSGEMIWKSGSHRAGYSSPAAFEYDGSTYIAAFPADGLLILDTRGRRVALHPWRTSYGVNAAMPVFLDGGRIFITSGYRTGCAMLRFDGESLTELWRNGEMASQVNTPVYHEGHLYGFHGQVGGRPDRSQLVCMDARTGEVKWTASGMGAGSLLRMGDTLVILSEQGRLLFAQATPRAFTPRGDSAEIGGLCWTVPAVSGGRIYLRNYDRRSMTSQVHALDVRLSTAGR